jgi:tRNA threonylcarbamoyladenosine biosynthesis protein TsaE
VKSPPGEHAGTLRVISSSAEETQRLGFEIGRFLSSQERVRTVLLYGDLGAGKTVLVKGIARSFGIPERDVGSASFLIVAEYETQPTLYHIDLYRLETEAEVESLGLWEYLDGPGMAVVEWAERLAEVPQSALRVRITHRDDDVRDIVIEGMPGQWVFPEEE